MSATMIEPTVRDSDLDDEGVCHIDDGSEKKNLCGRGRGGPPFHGGWYDGEAVCPDCGKPTCPDCANLHDLEERLWWS